MVGTSYDFIVVGAGSAGCVLANRLSADGASVLVLEAGGRDDHFLVRFPLGFRSLPGDPRFDWCYQSEPEPHFDGRRIPIPRGKLLGGTSSINGMFHSRGHRLDYDLWRQMGCDGWSYAELLPYFKRSETDWRGEGAHHGGSGPLGLSPLDTGNPLFEALVEAAGKKGLKRVADFHAEQPDGIGTHDYNIFEGRRASAAWAYLHPAMSRTGLTVETRAQATRVTIENGRAAGIAYQKGGEIRLARAGCEVILAGGAYNSPQLLLLSGIGPADELAPLGIEPVHDLPGVGKNLQDHFGIIVITERKAEVPFDRLLRADRLALATARWMLFHDGPAARFPSLADGYLRTRPELVLPDVQLMFRLATPEARVWFPGIRRPTTPIFSTRVVCLHPDCRGNITLASADPFAPPRIVFNKGAADTDMAALRAGLRALRDIFAERPFAAMAGAERAPGPDVRTDEEIDGFIRRTAVSSQHPVSTCRMGIDELSVVGPDLKVRGIEGLRVVDASIMPTLPTGALNATVVMIAEKAADMILGRDPPPPVEA